MKSDYISNQEIKEEAQREIEKVISNISKLIGIIDEENSKLEDDMETLSEHKLSLEETEIKIAYKLIESAQSNLIYVHQRLKNLFEEENNGVGKKE